MLGGHLGFLVTYMQLKQIFSWRGMKSAVRDFVKSCLICQCTKLDRARLPGLLQPLHVPASAWQVISMDFVEGLARSNHANSILVVVDSLTKYDHFLPLSHPFMSADVAKVFLNNVYHLQGLPTAIVSDRDRIFTSQLWRELFVLADVQLQMCSSYHPQSVGQTERLNQTMETFLRCFSNACLTKCYAWLPLAQRLRVHPLKLCMDTLRVILASLLWTQLMC